MSGEIVGENTEVETLKKVLLLSANVVKLSLVS